MEIQICVYCNTENDLASEICIICGKVLQTEINTTISIFRTAPVFKISGDDAQTLSLLAQSGLESIEIQQTMEPRPGASVTPKIELEAETTTPDAGSEKATPTTEESSLRIFTEGVDDKTAWKLAERFRPVCPVAQGGMGKILLVQERVSGRYVALKVMLEKALRDIPLVQQFVREAVISARLQHPNIIPVYDLGFLDGNQLYYTMRYIDGDSFNEVIYKVEMEERLRILRSAALAVDYAHSQGLWHRDLKPQNILVGPLGDTYVTDWGLVSIQPNRKYELNLPKILRADHIEPDQLFEQTRDAITAELGILVGTPAYMAPEQCRGEEFGIVSDVWAFGVMLFQALTGRHPIEEGLSSNPINVMSHVVYDKFPTPSDFANNIPEDLNSLCLRMLAKSIDGRMKDLKEFIGIISQYLLGRGRLTSTLRTSPSTSSLLQAFASKKEGVASVDSQPELTRLEIENQMLRAENLRSQKKIEILMQIAQLGVFSKSREKELWSRLAEI